MADFIISPYAISFNSIKEALESYISNKSNVTTTWQDFYTAGAGQTVLELDAALGAFYAFHFIIGRRESYLPTAMNYNSIVGGAQALGYNASRGHNLYLKLKLIPSITQTLPKWSIIGSYADYDVVLVEDAILNSGEETEITVVIGNSNAQSIKITTSDLMQLTFTDPNTTNDCRLILNSDEVPFSTNIVDAMEDKYVGVTNSYGSMDVFYLNQGNYKYGADDTLYLQYIERNNLKYGAFSPGSLDLYVDIAQTVTDISCAEDRQDVEDKEHIRISAPYKHEMNNVVRARKDYVKYLITNNDNIIDANDKDVNPGLIAMTYLKKDNGDGITLLTEEEKQDYIKSIMQMCPDGVATAFIEDPIKVSKSLDIKIWKKSGEDISPTISDDIDSILDTYRNQLQPTLDLEQIEHEIEKLPGIKVARVSLGTKEYKLNTKYELYDIVTVPNILVDNQYEEWTMYCYKINKLSGEEEPDWSSVSDYGEQLIDNNIVWESSNKYTNSISAKWKKDGSYDLYADVNVGYEVQPNSTTKTEPSWGKKTIVDGNVTFSNVRTYDSILGQRKNNYRYYLGDYVYVKDHGVSAVYKADTFSHKCGTTQPDWSTVESLGDTIRDNAIIWEAKYNAWAPKSAYRQDDLVAVGVTIGDTKKLCVYQALNSGVSTNGENPLDGSDSVEDSSIIWQLQEDLSTTSYSNWTASYEYEIGDYVPGGTKYFICGQNDYYTSGTGAVFYLDEQWLSDVTDNNVNWKLDTYMIGVDDQASTGTSWQAETAYYVGDTILTSSDICSYIYRVTYSGGSPISVDNKIFSVVSYCGTTSGFTPSWGATNVEDNDILWTLTTDPSEKTWTPNTVLPMGTIITIPTLEDTYYTFSSVLGTSGYENPNWTGIKNGQVEDNNIIWKRIINTTSIPLKWNEYLEIKFDVSIVG